MIVFGNKRINWRPHQGESDAMGLQLYNLVPDIF